MAVRMLTRCLGILVPLCCSSALFAGTIGLAWNPSAGATGYRVHYGPAQGTYTAIVDVGNVTEVVIEGPADCADSFYAVTAYNAAGESGPSREISSWPRPAISGPSPAAAKQGDRITLNVNGINFQPGATLEIDNGRVLLDSVTIQSCERIQAAATVEPTAEGMLAAKVGRFTLTVSNPDTQTALATRAFEVLVDPERFNVVDQPGPSENRLDGRDMILLSRLFGSRELEGIFDPDADFNGDGWVDGQDLAYLAGNLGTCWSGSTWSITACSEALK